MDSGAVQKPSLIIELDKHYVHKLSKLQNLDNCTVYAYRILASNNI